MAVAPIRRRLRLLMVALLTVLGATMAWVAAPAGAQSSPDGALDACPEDLEDIVVGDSVVHVAKVAGLIDPVVKSYLIDELDRAESDEVLALVIWMNSDGSVLDDADFLDLATRLSASSVPIVIWVGQAGATVTGGAAELIGVADIVGVSAGSTIGETGPARLPNSFDPAFGEASARLETTTIGADEAVALGISTGPLADVSTIGTFLTLVPGYEVVQCLDQELAADVAQDSTSDGGEDAAADDGDAGDVALVPAGLRTVSTTQTKLSGLPITSQLFHTVASPEVAYLLFALGLGLLLFELYTAGIGVAGVVGAGLLALGCYGLAVLPTRWWGVALLIISLLLIAVDVQTNVPRFYTAAGVGAFIVGTFALYDGVSMSWVTIIAGIVGAFLYAYTGMPSMVRTRFSTPTIGRRWMIGEMGEALTDVSPEGTVRIRNADWRAITNRATPVKAGQPVRVVGLDRLILEIEPEEGGAKDYRERG